uniref:Nodulin-like domain-containing protein n=2 Tax=Zea mays TaxID=4577 RepID=A0A804LTY9_MAIZE
MGRDGDWAEPRQRRLPLAIARPARWSATGTPTHPSSRSPRAMGGTPTMRFPAPSVLAMCVLIYVGTNGETFFNTTALVTCIQNFPKSRGQTVTRNMTTAYQNDQMLDKVMVVMGAPQGQQNGFKEAANSVEFLGSLLCVISYQD